MSMRMIVVCALALAGCGKSGGKAEHGGSAAGSAGSSAGSAGSASAAPAATYTLHEDYEPKLQVVVHVAAPPGWHDNQLGTSDHVVFQGSWMSTLSIGITCDGSCDTVAVAKANIAKSADEAFAFVSSKNHEPPLVATWAQRPTEISPGVWSWRFDSKNDAEHQEEHELAIERILPGDPKSTLILSCHAKIDEREPKDMPDRLYDLCSKLKYEVQPMPAAAGSGSGK